MESADAAQDTIAAIATPAGRGGIGVVRVSGPQARAIAATVLGKTPVPRHATLATMRNAAGDPIDLGIALFYPGPDSYTGESVLELQGHGGPVVVASVLKACVDAGARIAEPGEFTRRAFLNGKLDLAQAEGVADLIEATTAEAARSAVRSLSGEFSAAIDALVAQITELRALTEATLDFPEDEIDSIHRDDVSRRLATLRESLTRIFSKSRQGSLLRSGIRIVLAGRPNVGKSSLLNRLAGEDRAIVTPLPGTTRDTVHETIAVDGLPLNIVDTAGLHNAGDEVEQLGIARTWNALNSADVALMVMDASAGITAEDRAIIERLPEGLRRLTVFNKIDLVGSPADLRESEPAAVFVSALTGEGVDLLRRALLSAADWQDTGESLFVARERHLRALALARERLEVAETQQGHAELFAEELRLAQQALSEITGEFSADDLLGEIFSRFCIGK